MVQHMTHAYAHMLLLILLLLHLTSMSIISLSHKSNRMHALHTHTIFGGPIDTTAVHMRVAHLISSLHLKKTHETCQIPFLIFFLLFWSGFSFSSQRQETEISCFAMREGNAFLSCYLRLNFNEVVCRE